MAAAPENVQNPFQSSPVTTLPATASAAALVQREVAEVQAAMVVAKKFPRDPIAAMDRILQSCARPSLAHAALYQYSRGGNDISGPSIRLAEELARQWGNIVCGVTELTRSAGMSECLAYAWDLETNFRDEKRFQVKHWRDTKQGGYALKDERDIYELIANQGSRRKRACLLAVIPGDVQEAATQQCDVTLRTKADVTPERVKAMVEKFAEYNVTQPQIEKRIQRRIDAITPALMVQLGRIYNSLKDGMSQAADWFETTPAATAEQPAGQPQPAGTPAEEVKRKLRATKASRESQQPEPQQEPEKQPQQQSAFNADASRALDEQASKQ